jgi:zinc transporter ZupT
MLIVMIAFGTFCSTLAGGLFALRLKDRLHLILGFSAGAVVGVAFFDLIPEAIALGARFSTPTVVLTWVAVGFLSYLILDRIQILGRGAILPETAGVKLGRRGLLGATSLSAHSFLDGIVIGVALQASTAVGTIVTIAVLAHDFSDGINTANIVLKNGGNRRLVLRWLLIDALAPTAGIVSTLLIRIPNSFLGVLLGVFAGFFLYIGASDLIPESHHAHPKLLTTAMTLLGAAVLYIAVTLASR